MYIKLFLSSNKCGSRRVVCGHKIIKNYRIVIKGEYLKELFIIPIRLLLTFFRNKEANALRHANLNRSE